MNSLSKEWMGGFISGEGCFTYGHLSPVFLITLHKKDIEILRVIKKVIGFGKVTCYKDACYSFSGTKNAIKFIKIFDKHIHGDKLIDYTNWKNWVFHYNHNHKHLQSTSRTMKFIEKLKPSNNKKRIIYRKVDMILEYKHLICPKCNKDKYLFKSNKYGVCSDCFRKEYYVNHKTYYSNYYKRHKKSL